MPTVHDRTNADLPINSVVAPDVVDDPYEHGAKLRVLRSVRDDPLAGMYARGQIDDAMLLAGRTWQKYHEHSEIGPIAAIDPRKAKVDGGQMADPISARQMRASDEMASAKDELEEYDWSLVYDVCARRMSITQIALARSVTSGRQISYMMQRLRGALDDLAVLWNFAGKR